MISIRTRALVLFEYVSSLDETTKKILNSVPVLGTGYSHTRNPWGPDDVYVYASIGNLIKGDLTTSFILKGGSKGQISLVHSIGSFRLTDKIVATNLIKLIKEGIIVTEANIKYVRSYIRNKTSWNNILIHDIRSN